MITHELKLIHAGAYDPESANQCDRNGCGFLKLFLACSGGDDPKYELVDSGTDV